MAKENRTRLAKKRLLSILARHGVANARTLEQKISDAGPSDQRIDPHVLTRVRNHLIQDGQVVRIQKNGAPWFHLPYTSDETLNRRLHEQLPIFRQLSRRDTGIRIGQCLEISIYRALLLQHNLEFLGGFADLDLHDDSQRYSKDEPPLSLSGRRLARNQRLDFLVRHPQAGWAAIEAKNVREWQYPDREEITKLLDKATTLDCVPIFICRRFPFVTFKVLATCGVVLHQTYNQRLPEADRDLANKARDKTLLGYHDIRIGNQPDARLIKFIGTNLHRVLPEARKRFEDYKDLLADFGCGDITYQEFAARVRRHSQGVDEDSDWNSPETYY